ncbi:hypothetical protein SADUNF_Sadunf06G0217400 [Salix dunnii]|uniref:Uncharacterized protein n=1 Tax=Salix dunnii TaxID=1413687 RepID=A0A835K8M7_9ROSI|nr:hypothetical protein SADUNF_Sadunf06G0217400 [Salix dunnii]
MAILGNFLIGLRGKTLLFCLQYVILTTITSLIMESIFSNAWQQKFLWPVFVYKHFHGGNCIFHTRCHLGSGFIYPFDREYIEFNMLSLEQT